MIQLSIVGQAVELNERDFLTVLEGIAGGYITQARAYHHYHAGGFADWKNALPRTLEMVGWETPIETVEAQIGDEQLREAFRSLREHLTALIEIDEQIIEWLAGFVGLSSSQGERDRHRMDRRLHEISADKGPVWAMEQEYQAFAGRSEKEMLAVTEAKQRMDRRLKQLMGRCGRDGDALADGKASMA
jgi:hypothetical protein